MFRLSGGAAYFALSSFYVIFVEKLGKNLYTDFDLGGLDG